MQATNSSEIEALITRLRKGAVCVYLAAEEGPAADLADMLTKAADLLTARETALAIAQAERDTLRQASTIQFDLLVEAQAEIDALRDQVATLAEEILDDARYLQRYRLLPDEPSGVRAKDRLLENAHALQAQQLRVMGDVPVSNTPSTSKDRHGVVAARGADPDPSPDQLLRDELIRDRDTWSQACASAIRELREEREQLRSLIQTWRQEGLTARRPMDHDAINACADDLEALLPPDAPQEK